LKKINKEKNMSKKVCLIDGSGYIFRAFYALPPLTSPGGVPVNAVLGFLNMFMRLTNKIPCDYCLVLFDAKRQNFRNDIFPEYKATRKDIPEELIPQFPIIRQAVEMLNLNHLEMEGYEADDLIATYARQAVEKGYETVVVSADKDLMQLIRPGVEFYDSMKDKFFTPEDVKEKFGVYPEKVVDVQALAGDSTDNVPGVPGIGLKTAADLVNQFGSLDEVLARAAEIKQNARREAVLGHLEEARISEKLVRLNDQVEVEHGLEDYICRVPEMEKLSAFVEEYGLNSVRGRLERWVSAQAQRCGCEVPAVKEIEKKYELITDAAGLQRWLKMIVAAGRVALDTETTGLDPFKDKIVGFSLAVEPGVACYVPLAHKCDEPKDLFGTIAAPCQQLSMAEAAKFFKHILTAKSILKIGHNIKFDLHFIRQLGNEDYPIFSIEDTAVLSYDLDSSEHGHGLDELAELWLGYKMISYEDVCGSGRNKITFDYVAPLKALDYAAEDADITLRLYDVLKPRLLQERRIAVYENFDRPLILVLKQMEQAGIMLDTTALMRLDEDFEKRIKQLENDIYQLAGEPFNLGSPKQIGEILYGKFGLKGKKNAAGNFQTGADVLEQMARDHELPAKILEWRGFAKLKSTYTSTLLSQMDKNNRVHTTFNQVVVNTGRLASSNPNLQNIPIRTEDGRRIRECFIAKPGYRLISADYSQVELRLLAVVADVKALKEAFRHGVDVHALTASRVFGVPLADVDADLRRHAKAINFGIVYGISQYGLARQIDASAEAAKRYIDSYFAAMPEIKAYMDKTIEFARKNGYVLTPYGRKCPVPGITDKNKRVASFAERAAINAPIQGGAADIIKLAMKKIWRRLEEEGWQTRMLLQVHDELIFEAPESEVEKVSALIKEVMENVVNFDIPFIAEVGSGMNWAEAH